MLSGLRLMSLVNKVRFDKKYFPQLVYAGCFLAVYSFIIAPLAIALDISIPQFPLAQNDIFWSAWAAALLPGTFQRSLIKGYRHL